MALRTPRKGEETRSRRPAQTPKEIAEAQAKAGDPTGTAYTRERARKSAATIGQEGCWQDALLNIVKALVNAGDVSGTLRTAATIKDLSGKASNRCYIAEAQAKAEDVSGALKIVAAIGHLDLKVDAVLEIAEARANIGDVAGAAQTFEQALDAAAMVAGENSEGVPFENAGGVA